eukprot:TRINITY_DN97645_c0_g1_i1.p1 TRINITY_DN97645_c0_g1~~TRINITY_DN97645_c0_g1_i1.p1  ORF type:complete len:278 (-),score=54.24 TRINITY_DN97645_c0_g1_i1:91-903(-)
MALSPRQLTSQRWLKAAAAVMLVTGILSWMKIPGFALDLKQLSEESGQLTPHRLTFRLQELTIILEVLASRAELRLQLPGGRHAWRRGCLGFACLTNALWIISWSWHVQSLSLFLIAAHTALLFCAYLQLDFSPTCLSPLVVRAALGAGLAWSVLVLCIHSLAFGQRLELLSVRSETASAALTATVVLAVCIKYDWIYACTLALALQGISAGQAARGDSAAADVSRRAALLCYLGAVVALRCAYRRLQRAHGHDTTLPLKRIDSGVEEHF